MRRADLHPGQGEHVVDLELARLGRGRVEQRVAKLEGDQKSCIVNQHFSTLKFLK